MICQVWFVFTRPRRTKMSSSATLKGIMLRYPTTWRDFQLRNTMSTGTVSWKIWSLRSPTFGVNVPPKNLRTIFQQGLPYIPRVHLSEDSLVRSPLKWLWSEEPMVRRSFIPKFLYSESCYVPKIPYYERPSTIWILCCEGSLVRSSSSPKGAMFRTSIFRKSPLPHMGSILRRSFSPKFPQF